MLIRMCCVLCFVLVVALFYKLVQSANSHYFSVLSRKAGEVEALASKVVDYCVVRDYQPTSENSYYVCRNDSEYDPDTGDLVYLERLGPETRTWKVLGIQGYLVYVDVGFDEPVPVVKDDKFVFTGRRLIDDEFSIWAQRIETRLQDHNKKVEQAVPPKSDRAGG